MTETWMWQSFSRTIEVFAVKSGRTVATIDKGDDVLAAEAIADTIAAAPDLLDALRKMVAAFEDINDGDPARFEAIDAAREAIAMAEGE